MKKQSATYHKITKVECFGEGRVRIFLDTGDFHDATLNIKTVYTPSNHTHYETWLEEPKVALGHSERDDAKDDKMNMLIDIGLAMANEVLGQMTAGDQLKIGSPMVSAILSGVAAMILAAQE